MNITLSIYRNVWKKGFFGKYPNKTCSYYTQFDKIRQQHMHIILSTAPSFLLFATILCQCEGFFQFSVFLFTQQTRHVTKRLQYIGSIFRTGFIKQGSIFLSRYTKNYFIDNFSHCAMEQILSEIKLMDEITL